MSRLGPEAVVDTLRSTILDGRLRPGQRLDETTLVARLDISRNTLREAFRVLAHEHVVEHRLNRGVFVRNLTVKEAQDVYRTRRLLECGALRESALRFARGTTQPAPERATFELGWQHRVSVIRDAVGAGEQARRTGDWESVGTANGQFHLALARLADNDVIDRTLRSLLTEMRLLFLVVAAPRDVHEQYLVDNTRIVGLVEAGELVRAAICLEDYLLRAEEHLVGQYASSLAR
ncbi:MAG: GntR family transcriptional regulator [Actinomycetota bacterium]|nr:GntR family transcriptional regulator [Actinomycetota bacterium]